ncbi:MAG: leucine-rich repeat protein, partial [Firmicutes bacterium]|nr:leucine-rich repeat protein [Bacillota bacterium]
MRRRIISTILLLAMLVSLFPSSFTLLVSAEENAGEATNEATTNANYSAWHVALITDYGDITDHAFNQAVHEAGSAWCMAHNVDYSYYKPAGDSTAERVAMIDAAVADGNNVLLLPGYAFARAIVETCEKYQDVKFVALDVSESDLLWEVEENYDGNAENWDIHDYIDMSNVFCALYQEELAGFMAGYAAVKLGYTQLGFLGAMAVPAVMRYGYGFVQGIDTAAKELGTENEVAVNFAYSNQFYGDANITAFMDAWYAAGTQVVFACGGGVFTSVAEAAAKLDGAKVIGVDVDQAQTIDAWYSEGLTLTSAMKNLGATVNAVLESIIVNDDWAAYAGQIQSLGLVSATELEKNFVCLPESTQWNDSFTQNDYAAMVTNLLDGTYAVSEDTDAMPITAITVNYLGNLGSGGGTTSQTSGTCGENLTWSFDESTGNLTISGSGSMYSFTCYYADWSTTYSSAPWAYLSDKIKTVVIEEGVTSIGGNAFSECTSLCEITLPASLEEIDYYAFAECTDLQKVNITDIDAWCGIVFHQLQSNPLYYAGKLFVNDVLVTEVTFPADVTEVGAYVFAGCADLTNVTFATGITTIGTKAFYNCSALTSITIPSGVTYLSSDFCNGCESLTGFVVDEENANYSSDANGILYNKDKTRLIKAPGAYDGAFSVPTGVEEIYSEAFAGCKRLTSVSVPSGVTYIGSGAFADCSNLNMISVAADNTAYCTDENGVLYNKSKTTLYQCPGAFSGSYTIPSGVNGIQSSAFRGCSGLTALEMPDTVTWISTAAMKDCTGLEEVKLSSQLSYIASATFNGCTSLEHIAIPDGVRYISDEAFRNCTALKEITIPASVIGYGGVYATRGGGEAIYALGTRAFYGCSSLLHAHFLDNKPSFGRAVFDGCADGFTICYREGSEGWDWFGYPLSIWEYSMTTTATCTEIGIESYTCNICGGEYRHSVAAYGHSFTDGVCTSCGISAEEYLYGSGSCGESLTWELNGNGVLTISGTGAMESYTCTAPWADYQDLITSVVLPEGLTNIGSLAFENCTQLTSISISSTVTKIEENAFWNCTALPAVVLPESLESIGTQAFSLCSHLTEITIPASVNEIGDWAFAPCASLIRITVEESNTTYRSDDGVLFNHDGTLLICYPGGRENAEYILPDTVTQIGAGAFAYNAHLTSVTIHDGVCSIGQSAFTDCSQLSSVYIHADSCDIADGSTTLGVAGTTVLHAHQDSTAWSYAEKFGYSFESIVDCENGHHDYIKTVITQVSCTQDGEVSYTCSSCGDNYTESFTAWGHNYVMQQLVGRNVYTCSNCGDSYTENTAQSIAADETKEAVISAAGGYAYFMFVPEYTESYTFYSTGNYDTYGYLYDNQGNCLASNDDSSEGYNFSLTYTLTAGTTYYFGARFYSSSNTGSFSVHTQTNHAYEATVLTEPTCTEAGVMSYTCTVCGDSYSEGIPKLAHSFSNNNVCVICGLEVVANGTCGSNVYWYLCKDGTLVIGGTGDIDDRSGDIGIAPWYPRDTNVHSVVIEYGVTRIGSCAFYGCSNLTSVTIPESVTGIGSSAFSGCRSLTSVTIPEGVTSINNNAFAYCSSLTSVAIPESVTRIDDSAFYHCSSLAAIDVAEGNMVYSSDKGVLFNEDKSTLLKYPAGKADVEYEIPESVTSIVSSAFRDCSSLMCVTIPVNVTNIDSGALQGCSNLAAIDVAEGNMVYSSDNGVLFNKDKSTLLKYPAGKTDVEYEIPESITSVGSSAFSGCSSLTSVTILENVTSISNNAFDNCSSLGSITIMNPECSIYASSNTLGNSCVIFGYPDSTAATYAANYGYTFIGHIFENGICTICGESSVLTGNCGDAAVWTFDLQTGALTISGTGAMTNYSSSGSAPWYVYRRLIKSVAIESGVTSIGGSAFSGCSSLTSVTIPEGVTSIGGSAFSGCSSLTSVTIPESVTSIGNYAFSGCSDLTGVTVLNPLCSIGNYSTESTALGVAGMTEIHGYRYSTAQRYAKINGYTFTAHEFEDGVCTICGAGAIIFSGSCGESLTWTLDPASGCMVIFGSGNMPDYSSSSSDCAPWYSYRAIINSVILESGATSIGNYAFYNCDNLTSVMIPESVTRINRNAFKYCSSLTSVIVLNPSCTIFNSTYTSDSAYTLGVAGKTVIHGEWNSTAMSYAEKYGYTYSTHDFSQGCICSYCNTPQKAIASEIYVSDGGSYRYLESDDSALFSAMTGQTVEFAVVPGYGTAEDYAELDVSGKVAVVQRGTISFQEKLNNAAAAGAIAMLCFNNQTDGIMSMYIEDYIIPAASISKDAGEALTALQMGSIQINCDMHDFDNTICSNCGISAADCTYADGICGENLTWRLDGSLVLHIEGSGDMYDYTDSEPEWLIDGYDDVIRSVDIAADVTGICSDILCRYASLTEICVAEENTSYASENGVLFSKDKTVLYVYPTGKTETEYVIPSGVTSIADSAFACCGFLTSVTIPETVTNIGCSAFYFSSLTSVTIPERVTSIGDYAFARCSNLTGVVIPNGLICISDSMFEGCSSLTDVTIPDSVTSIGNRAFSFCSNLISVTIPESVTSIGGSAFENCSSLTRVTIPEGVTSIDSGVFFCCNSLESITIPDSVTSIGSYAFYGCSSLTSVTIPESVTSIGRDAFCDCGNLTGITLLNSGCSINSCSTTLGVAGTTEIHGYRNSTAQSYAETNGYTFTAHEFEDGICTICGVEAIVYSGRCGTNLTWTLNSETGSLVITGSGNMANYSSSSSNRAPWYSYSTIINSVILESGATSIGGYAFYGCNHLTNMTIPESVTSIGSSAFNNCSSLWHVHFIGDMPTIGSSAFNNCASNLTLCIMEDARGWENCSYTTEPWEYTCTTDCVKFTCTCNTCGEVYSYASEDAHAWVEDSVIQPTCTESGSMAFMCTVCGMTKTEEIAPLGHQQGELVEESDTYWVYQCLNGEHTFILYKDSRLQAMRLEGVTVTYSEGESYPWSFSENDSAVGCNAIKSSNQGVSSSTSATTITFTSEHAFTLAFDYMVSSESGYDKLTIKLDNTTIANAISGTKTYSYSAELTAGTHTLSLSYSKDGSVNSGTDSGYLYNIAANAIIPCEHENLIAHEAVAASCTESGYIAYWFCEDCGRYFSDAEANIVIEEDSTVIAPLGHTPVTDTAVDATCTETGLTEGSHCAVCNEILTAQKVIAALGHFDHDGDRLCDRCGADISTTPGSYTVAASLSVGDKIVIVAEYNDAFYAAANAIEPMNAIKAVNVFVA